MHDETVSPPPEQLAPLARALTRRFGYGIEREEDLSPEMREVDLDLDSLKDYQEARAETDASFAAGLLELKWENNTPLPVLRWPAVGGQTYRLMSAESIPAPAPHSTCIIEVTPVDTRIVQPVLPPLGDNLRYFWLEWEPAGYGN